MRTLFLGFCGLSFLLFPVACTYDQTVAEVACDSSLEVILSERTPSACGLESGSLTVITAGEQADTPLAFRLNGGDEQAVASFTGLAAGTYTVMAIQGACSAEVEITIENAEGLNAEASMTPSDCGSGNGSITVTTAGASGQAAFSLNDGPDQADATFTGLAPGQYEVAAQDEIGCRVVLEVTVLSTVAFADVEAIVASSCAISGCHAGNVSPDFRVRANILGRASRIGARTGNGSMPPPSSGNTLSSGAIDAIACWVADGAPE